MNSRAVLSLFFLSLVASVASLTAQHPNHPLGFDPVRAYQNAGDVDRVDLFSGSLGIGLPIGPFTLRYGSNVWRYETVLEGGQPRIHAFPDRMQTAGLGWAIGLGEVYDPTHTYNSTGSWLYVDETGGHHVFYQQAHRNEDDLDSTVQYTRDGSYIRMKKWSASVVDLHLADGSIRRFQKGVGSAAGTLRLTTSWGPEAEESDPTVTPPELTVTYGVDPGHPTGAADTLRTVTDRYGRQYRIYLTDAFQHFDRVITRVDLPAFGGARAVYAFSYANVSVHRSCKDDYSASSSSVQVPLLVRVDLPDGTSYQMAEGVERFYFGNCFNQGGARVDDLSGVLNGLVLPTGGTIRWEFGEYEFPPGEGVSAFNTSAGVVRRTLYDVDGQELAGAGTWRYRSTKVNLGGGSDPEMHTEVVYPTGDCSKHFFDARYTVDPQAWRGWEYSLPFVYSQEHGGRYLSRQTWSSHDAVTGTCAGVLKRSHFLAFRSDVPPGTNCSGPPDDCPRQDWYNLNRQIRAARTVYHDDGGRWTDVEYQDFDGVGHFRRRVETGTFRAGSTQNERRETYTDYDATRGTYPGASYVPVSASAPWVLDRWASIERTEQEATGQTAERREYVFGPGTGFLTCIRTLASGSARSGVDVVTTQELDSLGQPVTIRLFGGDLQPLSTVGAACGDLPAVPAYMERRQYQYGLLATVWTVEPVSGIEKLKAYDVDLDPASGLILRRRDPAGFEVTFGYDPLGRLTSIVPAAGSRTEVSYSYAGGGTRPRISVEELSASGVERLSLQEVEVDGFGRLRLERRTLPGGLVSERETKQNARGWLTSVSVWGDPFRRTERLNFDAFGRPGLIRPPAGGGPDLKLTYWGDRKIKRERRVWWWDPVLRAPSSKWAPNIQEFDAHGRHRLTQVRSGSADALVNSWIDHDVGGRVTRIETGSQIREFLYDNRGFLLKETHPELGAAGGGSVEYLDYDASGRAHRQRAGSRDIGLEFDPSGRLLRVRENHVGGRLLEVYQYDKAVGRGVGKPWIVDRYNWIDFPGDKAGALQFRVREVFGYAGTGGAVSAKTTRFDLWGVNLGAVIFDQTYTYDAHGRLSALRLPRCKPGYECDSSATRLSSLTLAYEEGALVRVPGWIDGIGYSPAGQWSEIQHSNGVTDHRTPDPAAPHRPSRLFTTGVVPASGNFDSGDYAYDGWGNVKAIGSSTFAYDKASRLVRAAYGSGEARQYSYDPMGNLTSVQEENGKSVQTVLLPTEAATNRLLSASYDDLGNLVAWPGSVYSYDSTNRLTTQEREGYIYDASGERAATVRLDSFGIPIEVTLHLRDLDHSVLSRFTHTLGSAPSPWARQVDYVRAQGRLVGLERFGPSGPEVRHVHADHLGSPRLVTRGDGSVYAGHEYLPYGEESMMPADDDATGFGGHERDAATGTLYMHARHYSPVLSRFMSVDPVAGDPSVPQSLNRYAFVRGNPVSLADPDGREPKPVATFYDAVEVVGQWFFFFPWRYPPHESTDTGGTAEGPGGGAGPQTGSGEPDGPPFPRDEEGRRDCSAHPNPVLCEITNVNRDKITSDFDCGVLAFAGVSLAGGGALGWLMGGGGAGIAAGARAPAIGRGITWPGWAGFGTSQIGFNISMVARGAAGVFPTLLPGGIGTTVEAGSLYYGAAAGAAVLPVIADRAVSQLDRALGWLWEQAGCGGK